jgi:NAD(P)-dependent dehydrogenase (short-subunit alcohol dehydrogenase family)
MTSGPGEQRAVAQQFAAFASVCRPFAPIYRQVTIAGVEAVLRHEPLPWISKLRMRMCARRGDTISRTTAKAAEIVLIGHSQGARILARLLAHELEGKPEQRLLAGALILGFDVEVPEGKDVGGTFKTIPLCRAAGQNGCVVAYETFPATAPPPDDSRFTHSETPGMEIACTDPAALAGGSLDPILATETNLLGKPPLDPTWAAYVKPLDTPFVSLPGIASGHCVDGPKASYLSVSINTPRRVASGRHPPATSSWTAASQELGLFRSNQYRHGQPHRLRLDVAKARPVAQVRRTRPMRPCFQRSKDARAAPSSHSPTSAQAGARAPAAGFRRAMTSYPLDQSGDIRTDIANPARIDAGPKAAGPLDAVPCAAGAVNWHPLSAIKLAGLEKSSYGLGLTFKLMGQVNLALAARDHINDHGSITLIAGVLSQTPIVAGSSASMVNAAIEAFAMAAAIEMPLGIRINAVSPTVFEESMAEFGPFVSVHEPVPVARAARAFSRSIEGSENGKTYRVV